MPDPDITQPNQNTLGTKYDEKIVELEGQIEARKARIRADSIILRRLSIALETYNSRLASLDGTTPENEPDSVTIEDPETGEPVSIPTIPSVAPGA